jgi:hypothetical protein
MYGEYAYGEVHPACGFRDTVKQHDSTESGSRLTIPQTAHVGSPDFGESLR